MLKFFINFTHYFCVVASVLILLNNDISLQELHTIDNFDFVRKKILETHHIFNINVAKSTQMFIYILIFVKAHFFETNKFDFDNNLCLSWQRDNVWTDLSNKTSIFFLQDMKTRFAKFQKCLIYELWKYRTIHMLVDRHYHRRELSLWQERSLLKSQDHNNISSKGTKDQRSRWCVIFINSSESIASMIIDEDVRFDVVRF